MSSPTTWRFRKMRFWLSVIAALTVMIAPPLLISMWLLIPCVIAGFAILNWYINAERRDMFVAIGLNPDGTPKLP